MRTMLLIFLALCGAQPVEGDGSMNKNWRTLSAKEARVIVHKGTERAYSNKYDKFFEQGVYICRRCGAALYRSNDKFDSGCGWPAFDAAVPGAVKAIPDADGRRTEILCSNCGGHLGHVFFGERLTAANTRHCVNSISMEFVPDQDMRSRFKSAIFAGGCFWGVEYYLQQLRGVITAVSGYTGGESANPTYESVCAGGTGHIEAVEVLFDPCLTNYERLARTFFEIHDPTQVGGQGPDIGEQYKSVVFYVDNEQKMIAAELIGLLEKQGYKVVTELRPAKPFFAAENHHQDYYFRKERKPYCHTPVKRFD
jgi:peptide methionine sulfoxide reductase msrA/msrB